MSLKFITSILTSGALIAALSTASPAAARDHDGVKIILGTAATILLLNELAKQQKVEKRYSRQDNHHQPRHHGKKWRHQQRWDRHDGRGHGRGGWGDRNDRRYNHR